MKRLPKNTEIELKLVCKDSSVWDEIMTAQSLTAITVPGSAGVQVLDAHYFDTETHCLQKEKIAYRIRREGKQWVATIKGGGSSSGGLHERQEWNIVVENAEPDITVFASTPIGKKLVNMVGTQVLKPILITQFERKTVEVAMPDGSLIEVAADQGQIIAGDQTAPILELELELKNGKPASLFVLGAALAREYALLPETDSKFYRGLLLAGLVTRPPVQVPALPQVHKHQHAGQELSRVIVQLITRFFVIQQMFLQKQALPEDVHELRICIRCLRSLLEFAGPEFIEKYKEHQGALRQLGQILGALREIDVAYASWKEWNERQSSHLITKINLGRTLSYRRVAEAKKVLEIFASGYATPILLELWATLVNPACENPVSGQPTMAEYTESQFSKWLKIISKQGKKFEWDDREKVHKLRLQAKRTRYVAEVLHSTLAGDVEQLCDQLKGIQDNLGLLNDIHSTELLLRKLLKGTASKALHLEAGMLIGWQGREEMYVQEKMNNQWEKFYRTAKKWL